MLTRKGIVSQCCAAIVISIAVLVFIGWAFEIPAFRTVLPGLVGMNPLTATCFILAGISLGIRCAAPAGWRWFGALLAWSILLVGTIRLAGYFFDLDVAIDRLLFSQKLEGVDVFPRNRMAPNTALGFIFSGAALIFSFPPVGQWDRTREGFGAAVILVSLLVLIGYVFGVSSLYGVRFFIPMALHTACSFLLLGVGILFVRPDHGFMAEITSVAEGGAAARILLPFAIGVPMLFGWLRILGVRDGWFSVELGLALVAVMSILVMVGVTVWMASMLNRQGEARRQTERALRESEERYHVLFDSIDEGFCIFEMMFDDHEKPVDYRFLQVNPSFEKQTGLKDAQGKRVRELIPQLEGYWFDIYGKIALTGQPARFENRAEQLHRWYDVYAFRIGEPEARQVAVLFNDITGRKQAEEAMRQKSLELEHANKELEAFSYSISHDLRAPLRAIEGFSNILEEDFVKDLNDEAKRLFGVIRANSRQMSQLIDDLLAFSRLGRKELEKTRLDMPGMVRSVIESQRSAQPERGVEVDIGELPGASGDAVTLQQVWVNLVSNAFKFTKRVERPRIEIRGWTQGQELIYSVRDNGAGFDMAYANKLFGVFQRLHRSDEFEGTGVGLAIVQRVIHRHGGRVWAAAKLNEGATFFFSLPANKEQI